MKKKTLHNLQGPFWFGNFTVGNMFGDCDDFQTLKFSLWKFYMEWMDKWLGFFFGMHGVILNEGINVCVGIISSMYICDILCP